MQSTVVFLYPLCDQLDTKISRATGDGPALVWRHVDDLPQLLARLRSTSVVIMLRLQSLAEQPHAQPLHRCHPGATAPRDARRRRQRRRTLVQLGGGGSSGGGGHGGGVAAPTSSDASSSADAGGASRVAVRDAPTPRGDGAHHVHSGSDGGRAPAASTGRNGRRRDCATTTDAAAGSKQVVNGKYDSGVWHVAASTFTFGAAVFRAARPHAWDPARAAWEPHAFPMEHRSDDSGTCLELLYIGSGFPSQCADAGHGDGDGTNAYADNHDVCGHHAVAGAAIGHGSGAAGRDLELAARLGLVLRGSLVAGECGRFAGHGSGNVSGKRLLGSTLPLLLERADGTRAYQHPPALRVRKLPLGRRTTPSAAHAPLRLRRETRRVLCGADAQPQSEQGADPRQRTGVGGRSWPNVLAHSPAQSALQETPITQLATPGSSSDQQANSSGGSTTAHRRKSPSTARLSSKFHARIPLYALSAFVELVSALCVANYRRWMDPVSNVLARRSESRYVTVSRNCVMKSRQFPQTAKRKSDGKCGKNNMFDSELLKQKNRTRSVLHSLVVVSLVVWRQNYEIIVMYLLLCSFRNQERNNLMVAHGRVLKSNCKYVCLRT